MKDIKIYAKRLSIVYLVMSLLSCMVSVLLYQFIFRAFDPAPLDIASLFSLFFTLTCVVYFVSTFPALLIRLLHKGPIEKKLVKLLISILLCAIATVSCMLFLNRLFENAAGSITSVGLFVFLGTYLLLDMQNAERQDEAAYTPTPATTPKRSFLSTFKQSKNKEPQQGDAQSMQSVQHIQAPAWFLYVDGQTLGPYTKDEITARTKWGAISRDTLVCDAGPQGGGRGWLSAQDAGFFGR